MRLDVWDGRRKTLFVDARCGNCDNWLAGGCDAEGFLRQEVRSALLECAPDIYIPGVRINPESTSRANLCPHFWPTWEYRHALDLDEQLNVANERDSERHYADVNAAKGYQPWRTA